MKLELPFHPVVVFPSEPVVLDMTQKLSDAQVEGLVFAIGRYAEKRAQEIYSAEHFGNERCVHMGVDLFARAETAVFSFWDGRVIVSHDHARRGDYGPTVITKHLLGDLTLYALHGHLSRDSLRESPVGRDLRRGDRIGWIGPRPENGDWPPHVHFQLSHTPPKGNDLPGVVAERDLPIARLVYPDPRLVLGPIYR